MNNPTQPVINAEHINSAAKVIHTMLSPTPLILSYGLSQLIQGKVYLKLENLQTCQSFKTRGAFWKFQHLSANALKKGVVTMSAGNHAQAVAFMAKEFGTKAFIYMPENASPTKVERTLKLGAQVYFFGQSLNDSEPLVRKKIIEEELEFLHPYDDIDIITGQGSIAVELFNTLDNIDSILIPVGGGGLASGIASYTHAVSPTTQIIGIQSHYCPMLARELAPEAIPELRHPLKTLADGIAVKGKGNISLPILRNHIFDMIVVDEFLIGQAIRWAINQERLVVEGAGAVGISAILQNPKRFLGQIVVIIISGGNLDNNSLMQLLK